jgi:uncharacterized protein (TIGR00297 family)
MQRLGDAQLTLAPLTNFDIGALCAAAAAFLAYRVNALTLSGMLAAFFVGTATYGALGPQGAAVLLAFFVTSVALSRVGRDRKRALSEFAKTPARNGAQVLANGGVAALCALMTLTGDGRYAVAFAGAFAAANADTWGTEIGSLARAAPRSILTWRPVPAGLSGGVSALGLAAELGGAALIGATSTLLVRGALLPVIAGGVAGALADSVLGASLQGLRWCPQCRRPCEIDPHECGATTSLVRGASWFGNDAVNVVATATGAAVAFALAGRL